LAAERVFGLVPCGRRSGKVLRIAELRDAGAEWRGRIVTR
jgi:hypothetical protein